MIYSAAMTEEVNEKLRAHLVRPDGQEDLCFGIWYPSCGRTRMTALLQQVIFPMEGDRNVHGNASFNPAFFDRALEQALKVGGGIAFIHSHPSAGWQGMSRDDVKAETRLAPSVKGATGLPLLGMTLAARDGAWSGRLWEKAAPGTYNRRWCASVRVFGARLVGHFNDQLMPPPSHRHRQMRTASAWGAAAQSHLARLKVGVVGLGSVGSLVAEALARTGVQRIELIDYDTIKEHNLDRTLHATMDDVRKNRAKVDVSAKALRRGATAAGFEVEATDVSVCEEEGYRRALDCDVIFSCVDRPWARSILNYIAYAHLIPVIDGGILVSRTRRGMLRGADWKAHVVGPTHPCLLCLGQYAAEAVGADRQGDFDDPSYLESLPDTHPAKANENVFGFSLGLSSLEVLQFIMLTVGPLGLGASIAQNYHLITGTITADNRLCNAGCVFPDLIGTGERDHPGTGQHTVAEKARAERNGGRG